MDNEKLPADQEPAGDIRVVPPPVELLLQVDQIDAIWPRDIAENETFRRQIEARRIMIERLDSIISRLPRPDISLQDAVSRKLVTETQVAELFDSLSDLLSDNDYARAALYIPFEFLPNANWNPDSEGLKRAAERFRTTYMTAWNSLLTSHDVRANFVNGDILDAESRVADLPRVVKAAHLIPKLVESSLLKTEDVLALLESSHDEILNQSIADACLVLADLGFLKKEDLARLPASALREETASDKKIETDAPAINSIAGLKHELDRALKQTKLHKGVTEKRAAWLEQERKQNLIAAVAERIRSAISRNAFSNEMLGKTLSADVVATCSSCVAPVPPCAVSRYSRYSGVSATSLPTS